MPLCTVLQKALAFPNCCLQLSVEVDANAGLPSGYFVTEFQDFMNDASDVRLARQPGACMPSLVPDDSVFVEFQLSPPCLHLCSVWKQEL